MRLNSTAAALAIAAMSGCASVASPFAKSTAVAPTQQTYHVPSVTTIGKTQETQQKGGIVISVATLPFTPKLIERHTFKQLDTILVSKDKYVYEVMTLPVWSLSPPELRFKIRIINNLDDVVRLSNVLVRFNLDGKDYALDAESSGMKSLIDGVLAPQEQREFTLIAAPADKLPNGSNVSLRIYGVPTGGSGKKGNFEWDYRITTHQESKEVTPTVERVQMRPDEAEVLERAERERGT